MRLRELEEAERQFLIVNGWLSRKLGKQRRWLMTPEAAPITQDEAVQWQKERDRKLLQRP